MEDLHSVGHRLAVRRGWLQIASLIVIAAISPLSGCAFRPFAKAGEAMAAKDPAASSHTPQQPAVAAASDEDVASSGAFASDEVRDSSILPPSAAAPATPTGARLESLPPSADAPGRQTVSLSVPSAAAVSPWSTSVSPAAPRVARAEMRPRSTTGAVIHSNQATFDREVLQSDVPVLVDFYAKWCVPCKALGPTLDKVAAENRQAKVVKVDIDDSPQLAARYGVKSVPSLVVIKDGQVVAKERGIVSKSKLLAMLDQ